MSEYIIISGRKVGKSYDSKQILLEHLLNLKGSQFILNMNDYKKMKTNIKELENKVAEKQERIEELEGQLSYECECNKEFVATQKALELACIDARNNECVIDCKDYKECETCEINKKYSIKNYLDQAQKQLEEENKNV